MNYMSEVAKMLGVELNKSFMCSNGYEYVLTKKGIIDIHYIRDNRVNEETFADTLNALLNGELSIKFKPWKPNNDEDYWCVEALYGDVIRNQWYGRWMDIMYYKVGNCYRTKEDAEENREKWISFYKSDEILEV